MFPSLSTATIKKLLTTLLASTALLLVSAQEAPTNPAATSWKFSKLDFTCNQVRRTCSYSFILNAPPGTFVLTCAGRDVPFGDKTYKDCTVTSGANRITSAQAYWELRPRRPLTQTEVAVSVGIMPDIGNAQSTEYYLGNKTSRFSEWQILKGKEFSVVPKMVAIA